MLTDFRSFFDKEKKTVKLTIYNYLGIFIMGMLLFRNVISVSEYLLDIVINCVYYKN